MAKPTNHDAYIQSAPEFAQPILEKIRKAVHKACPSVEETIKWSAPHFDYEGILVGMAAFKKHVALRFWRGAKMNDPEGMMDAVGNTMMSNVRFEKLSDMPTQKVLLQYLKEAMELNKKFAGDSKTGTKAKAKSSAGAKKTLSRADKAKLIVAPPDLLKALKSSKAALKTFEGFSYTNRKDYVEWVEEAKRPATREKRIATAVEWMAEGKPRNWKYMNC